MCQAGKSAENTDEWKLRKRNKAETVRIWVIWPLVIDHDHANNGADDDNEDDENNDDGDKEDKTSDDGDKED